MHTPNLTPRKSLYFDYRIHPFVRPPELEGRKRRHPVVVVGAGPVGLTTALELARYGVASVVLESECQVSEGSRAIVFTRRSLEILEQVGVGQRVVENGLPWGSGNSFFRGQKVFRMESPTHPEQRFPVMVNLQQPYLEEYLVEAAEREPLIELRWGSKVTGIVRNDDIVAVTVDTPEGEYTIESDHLVAADGARSPIRQLINARMEGSSYVGRFVIADIRIDLDLPTERLCFFDPEWNPGNTVLMHREPHRIWRIDYQLPAGESPEEALTEASLRERIDAQLKLIGRGGTPWELDWASVYSARAMTLPKYVYGRIAFTGDAAHMLPIFGVRGANTGFQDAQNLAWKLAMVVKGRAAPELLDSYNAERVGAAREIIAEAGKSTRFMTPPTHGYRLLRDATLSLALRHEFARPLLHWRTSRAHDYVDSPINVADDGASFSAGPAQGSPALNVRIGDGAHLLDLLGGAFSLLVFSDVPLASDLQTALGKLRAAGLPVRVIRCLSGEAPAAAVADVDRVIPDSDRRIALRYGVDGPFAAYLVRPDQHVSARWKRLDGGRLLAAMSGMVSLNGEA